MLERKAHQRSILTARALENAAAAVADDADDDDDDDELQLRTSQRSIITWFP